MNPEGDGRVCREHQIQKGTVHISTGKAISERLGQAGRNDQQEPNDIQQERALRNTLENKKTLTIIWTGQRAGLERRPWGSWQAASWASSVPWRSEKAKNTPGCWNRSMAEAGCFPLFSTLSPHVASTPPYRKDISAGSQRQVTPERRPYKERWVNCIFSDRRWDSFCRIKQQPPWWVLEKTEAGCGRRMADNCNKLKWGSDHIYQNSFFFHHEKVGTKQVAGEAVSCLCSDNRNIWLRMANNLVLSYSSLRQEVGPKVF